VELSQARERLAEVSTALEEKDRELAIAQERVQTLTDDLVASQGTVSGKSSALWLCLCFTSGLYWCSLMWAVNKILLFLIVLICTITRYAHFCAINNFVV